MSPDQPLARTLARPPSLCPFCEHRSPPGSKFCNECGAALHLRPCPHCGALNDITQTRQCARCKQDLGLVGEPAPERAAEAAETADWQVADERRHALVFTATPATAPPMLPTLRRWPLTLALALPALGALLAYRLYGPAAPPPAVRPPPAPAASQPLSPPPQAVVLPALAALPPPLAASEAAETVEDHLQREAPSGAGLVEIRPVAKPRQAAPAHGRDAPPRAARSALADDPAQRPTPPPGPCTDAVAALGLCAGDAANPSRRP
ncbi:zinc ribbon domain-containing protein [Roseateles sp. DAIF2]|uniref:zinc ribbon domain-containing protein n=1 Tax=Roseateles sp. DAIF2 TaxID=2714952 RepID=UPI0018A25B60|nr:zinc ribbon domain-containing protein [Roseateles sp. DAIF2]QPF71823.1 zinc ribbon domain-containing protein [Roseateles sp. DAIF2]